MSDRPALEETRPSGHGRARGLVSSRASGRRVEARTFAPPPPLRDVVASCWIGRWDLRGQAPHETQLIADPCVNVVCEGGDGADAGSRAVGVWTRLWRRRLAGAGFVRGVKLRAGAVRAFVDAPAVSLQNRIVPLQVLVGAAEARAVERAVLGAGAAAGDDAAGLRALAAWLEARRRDDPGGQGALAVALVDELAGDPQLTTVAALARRAGLGVRAVERLFREHVGATPKWVMRRRRLQDVALCLERGEVRSLARLAAELGYADQAHMARDFRAVVGRSPSEFARATT